MRALPPQHRPATPVHECARRHRECLPTRRPASRDRRAHGGSPCLAPPSLLRRPAARRPAGGRTARARPPRAPERTRGPCRSASRGRSPGTRSGATGRPSEDPATGPWVRRVYWWDVSSRGRRLNLSPGVPSRYTTVVQRSVPSGWGVAMATFRRVRRPGAPSNRQAGQDRWGRARPRGRANPPWHHALEQPVPDHQGIDPLIDD